MPYHPHNYLTLWEKINQKPSNGIKLLDYVISLIGKCSVLNRMLSIFVDSMSSINIIKININQKLLEK
jgi:hypothetical protein